jgi:pimeloyl-ACP methyl ester carboxylesterase
MVADYLASIQAPVKRLDIVPDAGHMVIWQRPEPFLALLREDLKLASAPARADPEV